jgi:hypothetical protein
MAKNTGLEIASITAVVPAHDASAIVVKAEAFIGEQRTSLEIAITTDLAPTMAIALLATTAKARGGRDGLDPALECLAADASLAGADEKLRLNLLFDKGAVLPVEMPAVAGERLSARLDAVLNQEGRTPS